MNKGILRKSGAGDGNRTRIRGLGSRYSTTEPRPPCEARVKTNRSILWPQALLFPDCPRTNSWIRVRAVLAARAIKDAVARSQRERIDRDVKIEHARIAHSERLCGRPRP